MDESIMEVDDVSRFGYSGIFDELQRLADARESYLHLSNCDPPLFGYNLDKTILNKIDQIQITKFTGYNSWNGDEELRDALSKRISRICGRSTILSSKIIPTYGVSEAFPLTFAALFQNSKGSVAIPDPSYIPLIIQARRFGDVWFYPLREDEEWNPDLDKLVKSLERREDTKAIVIITPNSPTGAVYSEKVLKEVVNIAGQYNLTIITDEIYDSLTFGKFISPLEFTGEIPVIYLNGFSKVYRLPGYRLGYIGWSDPSEKAQDFWNNLVELCKGRFGVTALAQEIAKLALQEPEESLQAYVDDVFRKQVFLTTRLKEIDGISVVPSKGGTYVFPKLNLEIKDEEVAKYLIKNHGIFVTPGSAYGSTYSQGYLRFVTLTTKEALTKGVIALEKTLDALS
ncbi:MAG: aminotransferase class I/II-fold pyridoxal phosphate-dependent enzyme [Candidatus Kariarchaeaceae archaeon]|jgi:aspartate/methionine/tyrosine aminotransferase